MKVRAFASKKSSSVVEWKVRMMAALVWITFILFLQASWVKGVKGQCEQRAALSRILENNEPQALVLPAGDEANSFISTQIRVSLSWGHIDATLKEAMDQSSLDSYFIEYFLSNHPDGDPVSDQGVKHVPAELKTEMSIMIDDDCRLLSVALGVMLNASSLSMQSSDDDKCESILHSNAKILFPAARHTNVNIFSNRAEFLWPPGCNHLMQPTWQLESCRRQSSIASSMKERNCHRDSLKKESRNRYVVRDLEPCQLWYFRLRTAPTTLQGITTLGHVLWSFEAKTVPVPHVQVIAGHDYVRLILDQSKCANEAVIVDWRVTVCEDWKTPTIEANNSSQLYCQNSIHRLTFFNSAKGQRRYLKRGYLQISNLKECQLYTVAITPTSREGEPLLPGGERFTSIHSTLCPSPRPPDIAPELDEERKVDSNDSNSELVVVLIVMVLIGSSMLCLALKSVSDINSGGGVGGRKQYYNPSYYDSGDYILSEHPPEASSQRLP